MAQCSYFDVIWSDMNLMSSHNGSFSVNCSGDQFNNGNISVPVDNLFSDNEYIVSVYTVVSREALTEKSSFANDSACTCKLVLKILLQYQLYRNYIPVLYMYIMISFFSSAVIYHKFCNALLIKYRPINKF